MAMIDPSETTIACRWTISDGLVVADEACRRIDTLIGGYLIALAHDESGWDVLYRDPADGRFWELTYPQSEMHGGGPAQLQLVAPEVARKKCGWG